MFIWFSVNGRKLKNLSRDRSVSLILMYNQFCGFQ
jgi:hypothetical protein